MSECSRCERPAGNWPEVGVLYVSPPLAHTRGKLRSLLWESDLPFGDPTGDVLAVEVAPGSLERLCQTLSEGLSETELRACKAVLVEKGSPPGLGMLSRTQDLATFAATVCGGWLLEMLREERLAVHFQPIVRAADPDEVFAYECLLRGLDAGGDVVGPGRMFEAARRAGLLFDLDRTARVKAIEEAARLGLADAHVFVNFDPTAIYDPAHCLRSTLRAVEASGLSPDRVIFEVTRSERVQDRKHLKNVLNFYRESGFGVALDDLGYGSPDLLVSLRPDFAKLDMGLVHGVDRDPYRATMASRLLDLATDLGIPVVAEGVETEEQWRWLLDHGADLVQGYLFAKPASPPPVPTFARA